MNFRLTLLAACLLLPIPNVVSADNWLPRMIFTATDSKTKLTRPGQALPSFTFPFDQPTDLQTPSPTTDPQLGSSSLIDPSAEQPNLPSEESLFNQTDNNPFDESETDVSWLEFGIAPIFTFQDANSFAPDEDIAGGGFIGQTTISSNDERLKAFLAGHYNGYSGGSDFSTSVGVIVRPFAEGEDLLELGVSYDWLGFDGRFGSNGLFDRHQITFGAGLMVTNETRLRSTIAIPVSGQQSGIFPPSLNLQMNPRRTTRISMDQRILDDLILTVSYSHLTNPDKSYAGIAANACLSQRTSLFAEFHSDMSGNNIGIVGLMFRLNSIKSCDFQPIMGTTESWFNTVTAANPVFIGI